MCIDMWRWQSKNPDGYGAVSELAAPRPLLQPYAINRAYAMGQDPDPCRTTDLRSLGARKGDCGLAEFEGPGQS